MSNWLVIGDTSFTGSALIKHLRRHGEAVAGVSLRSSDALLFCQTGGWDYVVNFAALNVVAPSWEHPAEYVWVNVTRQIAIWDALRKSPPKRYVHISTPEVYGSTVGDSIGKMTEDFRFKPSTPYATSRAAAEMLLQNYIRQYKFPAVITRAANVYGQHQQLYRIIPKLIHSILSGKRFPLEGGGNSIRGFVHVDDCAYAIDLIARYGAVGDAYHIATHDVLWIHELCRLICRRMDVAYDDVIEIQPDRPGKDAVYSLNADKLQSLGWEHRTTLDEGIRGVIDWMRNDWDRLKDMSTNYVFKP